MSQTPEEKHERNRRILCLLLIGLVAVSVIYVLLGVVHGSISLGIFLLSLFKSTVAG